MKENNTADPRNATIKHLRETAAARVENTSLRSVAREIGMSPTGLKKFLLGTAPYSPTLRRLRNWYVQYSSLQEGHVDLQVATAALGVLVHDLAPDPRAETAACLIDCVARGYELSGKPRPAWVGELQARYGQDAGA
ncbi:MAG TPA: hypothetical protein VK358_00955 [Longimicrobium sp.]|nr:hypothetical protein [Longimicrobium sp.]